MTKYRIALYATVVADNEEKAYDIARGIPFDQFDSDIKEQSTTTGTE